MSFIKPFLACLVLTIALDFVWLGYVVNRFNLNQLAQIGRIVDGKFDVWLLPAVITYILMALLVVFFVLPQTEGRGWVEAFGLGCLMGFCVYGVFDMTNLAILKNYPVPFALADMAWGTFLFGAITLLARTVKSL